MSRWRGGAAACWCSGAAVRPGQGGGTYAIDRIVAILTAMNGITVDSIIQYILSAISSGRVGSVRNRVSRVESPLDPPDMPNLEGRVADKDEPDHGESVSDAFEEQYLRVGEL